MIEIRLRLSFPDLFLSSKLTKSSKFNVQTFFDKNNLEKLVLQRFKHKDCETSRKIVIRTLDFQL